jgi:hypothetical protein
MKRKSKDNFNSIGKELDQKAYKPVLPSVFHQSNKIRPEITKIQSKKQNSLITVFCRIKESQKMYFLEDQSEDLVKGGSKTNLENYKEDSNVKKMIKYVNGYSKDQKTPLIVLDSSKHSMVFESKPFQNSAKKINKKVMYKFDGIISPLKSQKEMFKIVTEPIVHKLIQDQINTGMIFAYGYTNSGKTYSILGDTKYINTDKTAEAFFGRNSMGILPRILQDLIRNRKNDLNLTEAKCFTSEIKLSAFEIYKEKVYDLLIEKRKKKMHSSMEKHKRKFNEIETRNGKYEFEQRRILNINDVFEALKCSEKTRTIDDNGINKKSSRSHTVYKIEFKTTILKNQEDSQPNPRKIQEETIQGMDLSNKIKSIQKEIFIIDLAGAEKPNVEYKDSQDFRSNYVNLSKKKYLNNSISGFRSATKARFHSAKKSKFEMSSLKSKLS